MPRIRIATFNIENLFARLEFADPTRPADNRIGMYVFPDTAEARVARRTAEATLSDDTRQLTAQALLDTDADVVALQEVDNEAGLQLFRDVYLTPTLAPRIADAIKQRLPALREQAHALPGDAAANLKRLMADARAEIERGAIYGYARVIEGNDKRGIDVGLLSRKPLLRISSHAHWTYRDFGLWNPDLASAIDGERRGREDQPARATPNDRIFRRDCLEVDVDLGEGRTLTIYNCHFKANPPHREATYPIRLAEAKALRRIIRMRFGKTAAEAPWVICGDLNDYVELDGDRTMADLVTGQPTRSALAPLLDASDGRAPFAFDANQLIADPRDRWTSYFPRDDAYSQLDHILLSPALWRANQDKKPTIGRAGQPYRASRYTGPRYPRIGFDRPKASDHCPIVMELDV